MRHIISRFIAITVMMAGLSSCFFDSTLLYSDTGMATIKDASTLVTDMGLTYHIVTNEAGALPTDTDRIVYKCDVTGYTEGEENGYDVTLNEYAKVTVKDPLPKSGADLDALGDDGLNFYQGWIGNGYLNTQVQFTTMSGSTTEHDVELVYDDVKSNSDTLYFKFAHNAHDDCFENTALDSSKFLLDGQYMSFNLVDLVPEDATTLVIHLSWDWYRSDGQTYYRDKTAYYTCLDCRK